MDAFQNKHSAALTQAAHLASQGNSKAAVNAYASILKRDPKNFDALCGIAEVLLQGASYNEARTHLKKAVSIQPRNERAHIALSVSYSSDGLLPEAHRCADVALKLSPTNAAVCRAKAELLRTDGEYEKAYEMLKPFIDSGERDPAVRMSYARVCKRFAGIDHAIEIVTEVLKDDASDSHTKSQAGFALGEFLDQAERYDEAFAAFKQANEIQRKNFNVADQAKKFRTFMDAWSEPAASAVKDSGDKSDLPVFVLGMPRSGTTLVERIIGAHPHAYAGGERQDVTKVGMQIAQSRGNFMADPALLKSNDLRKHARMITRKFKSLMPASATRFVDKMPSNYIRLNLIAKLFPNATIIHTTRDPRDTCLSCYFHSFTGAYPYLYDLEHLGGYYKLYKNFTEHFIRVLGLNVLEVPYESVVEDQEAWSRKIIAHAGLEWDDACLRFYEAAGTSVTSSNEQVRKPIYKSSVARWRNYETHLGPLFDALGS